MTTLIATERIVLDPGYRRAYQSPESMPVVEQKDSRLSKLRRGQRVQPRRVLVQQHTPPKGLSEAELIRLLRARGIGRPSTYAAIVATLLRREYVQQDNDGHLLPTARGREACNFLTQHYPRLFDPDFTARLEAQLDAVAAGQASYQAVVRSVWDLLQNKSRQEENQERSTV